MHRFEFAWVVEGSDISDDASLDRLYETFDDVSVGTTAGRRTVDFVVEAASQSEALFSTLETFVAVFPEAHVLRLDRDLVPIPDIADRTNRTPESVRLLANGRRGAGGFPSHVGILGGGTRVWEWATVADWFVSSSGWTEENQRIDHETACYFDAHLASCVNGSSHQPFGLTKSPARRSSSNVVVVAGALDSRYEVEEPAPER